MMKGKEIRKMIMNLISLRIFQKQKSFSPSVSDFDIYLAKDFLAKDRIRECLDHLLSALKRCSSIDNSISEDELIIFSATLEDLEKSYRIGLIDYSLNRRERNRLIKAILDCIGEVTLIGSDGSGGSIIIISKNKHTTRLLKKLATNLKRSQIT